MKKALLAATLLNLLLTGCLAYRVVKDERTSNSNFQVVAEVLMALMQQQHVQGSN